MHSTLCSVRTGPPNDSTVSRNGWVIQARVLPYMFMFLKMRRGTLRTRNMMMAQNPGR
jgi:hypothetical protein